MSGGKSLYSAIVQVVGPAHHHAKGNTSLFTNAKAPIPPKKGSAELESGGNFRKNLDKGLALVMQGICGAMSPMSVTNPAYPLLVRAQAQLLACQDAVAARGSSLPPLSEGSSASPAQSVVASELKVPGDGHCCYHVLSLATDDLDKARSSATPTFTLEKAKRERAAVAKLFQDKGCPEVFMEYQDKLSLSAAMARLLEGVGGSDMGGIPEVRARAVEKGYVVRYENLDVTSFTHSYELVGDLSANREVLLFHQGNHNWTAQLNKAGSFTTVFKRDDASEMQELERLVKDVRAQLGRSLVAIPSKTTTPSKKTSSDPSGEVELTVYGLRLPRSANSAKQRLEKLGLKGSTIIKVDKSRKGADMRRVVFSHQEAADDAKKLVQTIRETTGADINCSSEGNPVVDGALSARLEGREEVGCDVIGLGPSTACRATLKKSTNPGSSHRECGGLQLGL